MTPCIGIDLGGTKTEVIVLDDAGKALYRARQATPTQTYEALLQGLLGAGRGAGKCGDMENRPAFRAGDRILV